MFGYEEDYEQIEEACKFGNWPIYVGEFIFFAFGFEPQGFLDKSLSKIYDKYKPSLPKNGLTKKEVNDVVMVKKEMKAFALELLESGETVMRMSEKYRSNGGIGHT